MKLLLFVALAGCHPGAAEVSHPRATTGTVTGIARDHDSGDVIARASIRIGNLETITHAGGDYSLDRVAPGTYTVIAQFAGQPITVEHVTVRPAETTVVDLTFTLGRPEPLHEDYAVLTAIDRYKPKRLAPQLAMIEGTVNDSGTHERIAGAVVTAIGPTSAFAPTTLQTVSDDQGRYRFDTVQPGIYSVSTYYSVGGRAQIEVRRSDITVDGAEAVVVPLWIESTR